MTKAKKLQKTYNKNLNSNKKKIGNVLGNLINFNKEDQSYFLRYKIPINIPHFQSQYISLNPYNLGYDLKKLISSFS